MNNRPESSRKERGVARERGQVLVVFALALIAIVAMTGLVLDGGSTFVQRRDQQNVADAAAMAAGYAYATTGSTSSASTAGQTIAGANGYTSGAGGVSVTVTNSAGAPGWYFTAVVSKPHQNNFTGLIGMPTWGVTTQASVLAGRPNAAIGAMPIIFNRSAFDVNGAGDSNEKGYSEPDPGNQDVPLGNQKFNWTEFCNNCNADSNTVRDLIVNNATDKTVVKETDHISPLNAGSHTTLFDALAAYVGKEFAVPVVDDNGIMVGFATFHLTGAVGGSTKQIRGYFVSPFKGSDLTVVQGVGAGGDFGSYDVQLTN
jgi:Putative Flp pilus-assembly TadE/G-like